MIKKNIIWFPAIRTGSGTDTFTIALAKELTKRGFNATITWLPHNAEFLPFLAKRPVAPDNACIVHINSWLHPHLSPSDLPKIQTCHLGIHDNVYALYKSRFQTLYHHYWVSRIEQSNIDSCDITVCVSKHTANIVKHSYNVKRDIHVIYNGVNTQVFQPDQRRHIHSKPRILFVGNLTYRKGADLLKPIYEKINNNFELILACRRSKIEKGIKIPSGAQLLTEIDSAEKMKALYQSCDILFFPSRLEGFPLSVLEAQACGLPVVCSSASSLPELVSPETGIIVEDNSVESYFNAIRSITELQSQWRHMKDHAREHIAGYFDIRSTLEQYIALYCRFMN